MKKLHVLGLAAVLAWSSATANAGFWSNIGCSMGEVLGGLFCATIQSIDLGIDLIGSVSSGQNGLSVTFNPGAAINEWVNDVFTDTYNGTTTYNEGGTVTKTFDGDEQSCFNESNPIDDCDW